MQISVKDKSVELFYTKNLRSSESNLFFISIVLQLGRCKFTLLKINNNLLQVALGAFYEAMMETGKRLFLKHCICVYCPPMSDTFTPIAPVSCEKAVCRMQSIATS